MSRCRACDAVLTQAELSRKSDNGDFEDLCGDCGYIVFLDVEDLFIEHHSYAHSDITECDFYLLGVQGVLKINDTDSN